MSTVADIKKGIRYDINVPTEADKIPRFVLEISRAVTRSFMMVPMPRDMAGMSILPRASRTVFIIVSGPITRTDGASDTRSGAPKTELPSSNSTLRIIPG